METGCFGYLGNDQGSGIMTNYTILDTVYIDSSFSLPDSMEYCRLTFDTSENDSINMKMHFTYYDSATMTGYSGTLVKPFIKEVPKYEYTFLLWGFVLGVSIMWGIKKIFN